MIYVSQTQIDQVEYLIEQSIQGNHILFDADSIKKVLSRNIPLSESDAYEVEPHLEKMIEEPSLERKKAYLEKLDPETYEKVVQTYFNIVENNLYENQALRH